MEGPAKDWFDVVFGSGVGQEPTPPDDGVQRTEIAVRHSPSRIDLAGAPGGTQRVRVTVAPSEPGLGWALYIRVLGPGALQDMSQVWWRVEPGTWQPLMGSPQVVAAGRGRVRLDVDLKVRTRAGTAPRLQLTALSRS